jgi:hypothetical protein
VTAWQWRVSQKVTLKQQAKAQFDDRALVIRAPYGSPAFVKKTAADIGLQQDAPPLT